MNFTKMDNNYQGTIPVGTDLVVVEQSDVDNGSFESALTLYGFDELGMFDGDFTNPVYGFLDIKGGEGFSVPDNSDEVEELEWLVENNADDGSWVGR